MAETADIVTPSGRVNSDSLMGAFGIPDTENTIKITYTGTAAAGTTFKKQKWYRFISSTDCYLLFKSSGNATSSHMFMKAWIPEVFYMGTNTRVSAVQDASGGSVFATQMMTDIQQSGG